jgi:WD40 repeat protein
MLIVDLQQRHALALQHVLTDFVAAFLKPPRRFVITQDGSITVVNAESHDVIRRIALPGRKQMFGEDCLACSPSGEHLAVLGFENGREKRDSLYIFNVEDGSVLQTVLLRYDAVVSITQIVYAPGGERCAVGVDVAFCVVEASSGGMVQYIENDFMEGSIRDLAYAPDGVSIAAISVCGRLWLVDVESRDTVYTSRVIQDIDDQFCSLAYTPDSDMIIIGYGVVHGSVFCTCFVNARSGGKKLVARQPSYKHEMKEKTLRKMIY